jgi:hypothetical protein
MASIVLTATTVNAVTYEDGGSITLPDGVTPDTTVDTTAYLSFRPNPVGLGQTFLVNVWLTPATHVSRYLSDYVVIITKPDGTVENVTMDSYKADTTAYFEYEADQVGTWTLQFVFNGGYFPAGNYTVEEGAYLGASIVYFNESCYYEPSQTEQQTLVVQDDAVSSWVDSTPTPTDYWTRPVSPEHREWASILGNYPANGIVGDSDSDTWATDTNTYMSNYNYIPYVQAPSTSHIVWKRQGSIAGLVGGSLGQMSIYSGGGNPTIVYAGRCYQSVTEVYNGVTQSVWQCYDLQTGEIYWEKTGITQVPTMLYYDEVWTGTTASGSAANVGGLDVQLMYIGNSRMIRYDAFTGAVVANISLPVTTATRYANNLYLSVQTKGSTNYLVNWTVDETVGAGPSYAITYAVNIVSNVTYPWSSLGTSVDYETGVAVTTTCINDANAIGAYYGTNIKAASIITGALLWNKNVTDTMYSSSCTTADHGLVAVLMMSGSYNAYDLDSGDLVWTSETMDYPWASNGFGAYSVQSAYGLLFREAYDGVYAFDWDDGSIVWHYISPANAYETPYTNGNDTVYSFDSGAIVADGKLYTYTCEHTPSQPITRGWNLCCIDAYTGEGVWNITGAMSPGAISDGYLTASNNYDGYMYVFGKGESETTVSAPQTQITSGTSAIISGTVLDMSSAQEGTACVSEATMSEWMEYLNMQHSMPSDFLGVSVSIDAVDPNGNSVHIADVTTDASGTYSYTWTPTLSGNYAITATFVGSNSYGSSWSETHATVVDAPAAAATATPISFDSINSSVSTTVICGVIAIIIAIALVGILLLKKK